MHNNRVSSVFSPFPAIPCTHNFYEYNRKPYNAKRMKIITSLCVYYASPLSRSSSYESVNDRMGTYTLNLSSNALLQELVMAQQIYPVYRLFVNAGIYFKSYAYNATTTRCVRPDGSTTFVHFQVTGCVIILITILKRKFQRCYAFVLKLPARNSSFFISKTLL